MSVHSTQIEKQNIFIGNEIPSEDVDGINKIFTLEFSPVDDSVIVRLNGIIQVPGIDKDYVLLGSTVTFNKSPKVGMEVVFNYFKVQI